MSTVRRVESPAASKAVTTSPTPSVNCSQPSAVHRHYHGGVDQLRHPGCAFPAQRHRLVPEPTDVGRTDEEHGDGHPPDALGDLLDDVHPGVVPGHVHRGQPLALQHQRDTVQEGPTGHVQVVDVLVVGQQDGIHRAQLVRADGRSGELGQHPRRLVGARFVERRVGEQRDAAQSEEEGRATDQQRLDRGRG